MKRGDVVSDAEFGSFENLIVSRKAAGVVEVSLNRPRVLNAFNSALMREWISLFESLANDPSVLALVLTGEGRAFCSGADLKERNQLDETAWHAQHRLFDRAFDLLRTLPAITIAAPEAIAMGGGFELSLACDLIVAARGTRFALPEVKRGIIPGEGGPQVLARRCGPGFAKLLIATGRELLAEDAAQHGIVDVLVETGRARDEALQLAMEIAQHAPLALRQAKLDIDMGLGLPLSAAILQERELYRPLVQSEDRREGTLAFNEKRAPRFQGR